MRTIEKVVDELARLLSDKVSGLERNRKTCGELLDEILEISKANESVKGDLISRSALIKNLTKLREEKVELFCLQDRDELKYMHEFNMIQNVLKVAENQPTACNDGWIPCSERLPEDKQEILITDSLGKVRQILYNKWLYENPRYSHGVNMVAWQPLPQPYKENENG